MVPEKDYLFYNFKKKGKKYSKALSCGIKLSDQQQDIGGGTSARTEEVLCWVVIETIKLLSLACSIWKNHIFLYSVYFK